MDSISLYLPGIILAYTTFLLGIASPGPNVLAIMGTSMRRGRDQGLALALGIAFGSLTWALLTIIGLTALLAQFPFALNMIKVFGGGYLLWLAWKAFRAASGENVASEREIAPLLSAVSYFCRGYLIQMTNPKAAMVWVAIISLGIQNDAPLWVGVTIVVGIFALSVLIHAMYALAFSSQPMIQLYTRARRIIQRVLGVFFTLAGGALLVEVFRSQED